MKSKVLISYLMVLLCLIMGSISELPHHHHDGVICMNLHHMENSHSHNNGRECKSCCSNYINIFKKQEKEQSVNISVYKKANESVDSIKPFTCYIAQNTEKISDFYVEKLHSKYLHNSKGLRSPPFMF